MTTEAENGQTPNTPDTAPEGHLIPKHRLDEVTARLRDREREIAMKDELLNQFRPQHVQVPEKDEINYEELGLDPNLGKAIDRIVEVRTQKKLQAAGAQIGNQIRAVHGIAERSEFLVQNGKEKAKYMDSIEAERRRHYQLTGTILPIETAYKLVRLSEIESTAAARPAVNSPVENANPNPYVETTGGAPDSRQTLGQQNAGTQNKAPKNFSEMTVEEMEAHLPKGFSEYGAL